MIGLSGASSETVVLPLLATQILWINLVTDSTPALAMGVDPEIDDVMARQPRRLTDRAIDGRMWGGIISVGLVMALVTLFTIDVFLPGGLVEGSDTLEVARTAGFTTLVLAQLLNALNARSETTSAFHGLFTNKWLWGAIVLGRRCKLPWSRCRSCRSPSARHRWTSSTGAPVSFSPPSCSGTTRSARCFSEDWRTGPPASDEASTASAPGGHVPGRVDVVQRMVPVASV